MPFDAKHTIAELEIKGLGFNDTPDLDPIREAYPELAYIFDYIERLEDTKEDRKGDIMNLENEMRGVETRVGVLIETMKWSIQLLAQSRSIDIVNAIVDRMKTDIKLHQH